MYKGIEAVPWRSWDEWEQVYRLLYSQNEAEILQGVAHVSAWRAKQDIPIAIEVTATLQRELHGTRNVDALSLGIIRFINGVVEPIKDTNLNASISSIGMSYGIPDFIVEIRHSATHGRMPSFELASLAALRALDYLRDKYWDQQLLQIKDVRDRMHSSLLSYFLEGIYPFAGFTTPVILSFGTQELTNILLNPSQTKSTITNDLQDAVIQLLLATRNERRIPKFEVAFGLSIGQEAAKGNQIAGLWVQLLLSKGMLPQRSLALLMGWADPAFVPPILTNEVNYKEKDEDKEWPPTSIGYMPLGGEDLTLNDDEWCYADDINENEVNQNSQSSNLDKKQAIDKIQKIDEEQPKDSKSLKPKGAVEIW